MRRPHAKRSPEERRRTLELLFTDLYGFFTKFVERDTSDLTLLDFGSGPVGYVTLYNRHFGRCIALDVNDYARHYDESIEFMLSDGRDIPLPDRSVDVIVSHSTLEHVQDLEHTIAEMDRVLIEGGYAYLTVSPLYFSPEGGHLRVEPDARRLSDWEHLDPTSPYYRGVDGTAARLERETHEIKNDWLNQMTTGRFLGAVGKQPWDIVRYRIKPQRDKPLPPFLLAGDLNRADLYTKEFRLIARKSFSVVDDQIVDVSRDDRNRLQRSGLYL
jgi:SAM-dependent methyltransferase